MPARGPRSTDAALSNLKICSRRPMSDDPKAPTVTFLTAPVPDNLVLKAVELDDEELMRTYIVNAIPAALMRPGSVFWDLQAAVMQEAKRRGLKMKGKLQ